PSKRTLGCEDVAGDRLVLSAPPATDHPTGWPPSERCRWVLPLRRPDGTMTADLGGTDSKVRRRTLSDLCTHCSLAPSYIALAIPSYAARIAANIRFFQHHGLPTGASLAIGGLDAVAHFVDQVSLLAGILLLTPATLDVGLGGATPSGLWHLVVTLARLGVTALAPSSSDGGGHRCQMGGQAVERRIRCAEATAVAAASASCSAEA
ncbi:MAG: hypothetical protein M3Z46_01820, partial [Actinomycetota bacterium]|nr:hypothetical protein [Actinomycetota bacterium]